MERMTAEEAYRGYRKLEVYDADEVDREIKRLRDVLEEIAETRTPWRDAAREALEDQEEE